MRMNAYAPSICAYGFVRKLRCVFSGLADRIRVHGIVLAPSENSNCTPRPVRPLFVRLRGCVQQSLRIRTNPHSVGHVAACLEYRVPGYFP
jgi:hypothetical protein